MSVLDLGCGMGDVSLLAARLVRPSGHVTIGPGFIAALRNKAPVWTKQAVVGGSLVTHFSVNWGAIKATVPTQ